MMTHDEIIEVIQAHKDGKPLQVLTPHSWKDLINEPLTVILDIVMDGDTIRVKPEPVYVPWTADDWREFSAYMVTPKINNNTPHETFTINSWNVQGVNSRFGHITYSELLKEYKIYPTDKPCGKLVDK